MPQGNMCLIGNLLDPKYELAIGDNADAVKAHLGEVADGYDGFLVYVKDGDYAEVWGFTGLVPYNWRLASRLYPNPSPRIVGQ